MFGALMGHLGRAKRQIDTDADVLNKQEELKTAINQRGVIESQRLYQLKQEQTQANKLQVHQLL